MIEPSQMGDELTGLKVQRLYKGKIIGQAAFQRMLLRMPNLTATALKSPGVWISNETLHPFARWYLFSIGEFLILTEHMEQLELGTRL